MTDSTAPDAARLADLATRFPDLVIRGSSAAELQEIETKYAIRLKIAEQETLARELALKERAQFNDMQSRRRELALKKRAASLDKWANPLTVGVIVAALGLIGNFLNGVWGNYNQRSNPQNDLIKEAIKSPSEQERAKSLVFFANSRLISLDPEVLKALVVAAGSPQPVPGSSSAAGGDTSQPVFYQQAIVDRIVAQPCQGLSPVPAGARDVQAIVLHNASAPDTAEGLLRNGMPGLPGPLAHWLVKTDGTIVAIAPESVVAQHVGRAAQGLSNANTIGIQVTGDLPLADTRQVEALVRLVANVADRWRLPAEKIFSHAELSIPAGRKVDMQQQAPAIRDMVKAIQTRGAKCVAPK